MAAQPRDALQQVPRSVVVQHVPLPEGVWLAKRRLVHHHHDCAQPLGTDPVYPDDAMVVLEVEDVSTAADLTQATFKN
jgi:hypothetical protein